MKSSEISKKNKGEERFFLIQKLKHFFVLLTDKLNKILYLFDNYRVKNYVFLSEAVIGRCSIKKVFLKSRPSTVVFL